AASRKHMENARRAVMGRIVKQESGSTTIRRKNRACVRIRTLSHTYGNPAMRKTSALAVFAAVSLATTAAGAFCGFYVSGDGAKLYNNATQVVLMRDGTRTVLSMQNNYQ